MLHQLYFVRRGRDLKNCLEAFIRLLELLGPTHLTSPTELVAVEPAVATFLRLHGIVSGKKKSVWY
jgi:hypothetical protein